MSDDFDINKILEEKANFMQLNHDREENSLLKETSHVLKKIGDYETHPLEIKYEPAENCTENPSSGNVEVDFYLKIEPQFSKEEYSGQPFPSETDAHQILPERSNVIIKEEHLNHGHNIEVVKQETTEDSGMVSYDYPQFDGQSIGSSEGSALGHVEACLQEELNIKNEADLGYDVIPKSSDNCNMERVPGVAEKTQPNESLLTPTENPETGFDNMFQLNSITGNVMSLADQAFGLRKRKVKDRPPKTIPCPKCTNMYRLPNSLKTHLRVHDKIEQSEENRRKGFEKKKKNRLKKLKEEKLQNAKYERLLKMEAKGVELTKREEGFEYPCTCGKRFKRRTTMESCLRSHDECVSESKKYSCFTCSKFFKDKDQLALHRKRLHSRKKFPCKFCPTEFSTQRKLVKHLRKHKKVQLTEFEVMSKAGKLKCPICRNSFTDFGELKTHITAEHKPPHKCRKCSEESPTLLDFTTHLRTKHSDNNNHRVLDAVEAFTKLAQEWKCDDCHLQFNKADELALHKLEQHTLETKAAVDAETQFQCEDCRRVFASAKSLNTHRRVHHALESTSELIPEITGLLCIHCRKVCKDEVVLTSHMRFHAPERKYVCKFCDFRFATPEKRKTHAEIHTGDLKYVCFICEYQCSSFERLTKHKVSAKHLSMKEYLLNGTLPETEVKPSTEISDKPKRRKVSETKKSETVESSDNEESSNEVLCDICEARFPSHTEMQEHKQTHPFIEFPNDDKPSRIFFK